MSKRGDVASLAARVLAAGALVGCSSTSSEPSYVQDRPLATSTAAPTGVPSVAPTVTETTAETKSAASELVAVAQLPYDVRFHAVGGMMLASSIGPSDGTGTRMGIVDGDNFIEKPELTLKSFWAEVVGAAGTWPQGVDLVVIGTNGRTGIAELYTLTNDAGWLPKSAKTNFFFSGIATVGDSTVVLETESMLSTQAEIKTLRGPKLVRKIAPLDKACADEMKAGGQNPRWTPKIHVMSSGFGATKSGILVSVGSPHCSKQAVAEVWAAGSQTSTIVELPKEAKPNGYSSPVVTGKGPDEAWVLAGRVLAFDGNQFRALPAMPDGLLPEFAAQGPDGLYVISASQREWDSKANKQVWVHEPKLYRTDGKSWAHIPMPAPPVSVASDKDGTIWVSAGSTLWRKRKSDAEQSKVAVKAEAKGAPPARAQFRVPRPAGPLCPTNVVVLYGFTKVTPDDYDFPATRKALKGKKEFDKAKFVVVEDNGQKFLSAFVPDVSLGRKLVQVIEKDVAGSKPQLLCAQPKVLRELKIDLATGEVVK